MKLSELKVSLEQAITAIYLEESEGDIDVAFEVSDESGHPRYIYFNMCTAYTEDRLIVFSIEGPVTEIFGRNTSP